MLAANPKDQAALVAEATIFENHKLNANALDTYNKLREQWPDAVWIKSKIFDLEQTLPDQAAAATAAAQTGGQTYALLVGISKYAKPELSLQYADADASVFSKLLESPLGGGVPREQCTSADRRKGHHSGGAQRLSGFSQAPRRQEGHRRDFDRRARHGGGSRQQERLHPHLRFRSAGSEEHRAGSGRAAIAV